MLRASQKGSKMKKVKTLVTGGAGFMGSHIAEELVKNGYDVVALDDLSGGFKDNVPKGTRFVKGSILDEGLIEKLFAKERFEYVFHLAAYAAEGLSHFIKRFNYNNNVIGSVNLINESIKHDVQCFVFTSSIAVYGANQLPMREDLIPHPEDSYGIAKLAVEKELEICKEMFGLNYIIFRPHNVYGERQNLGDKYRNVIGIFMNNIMQNKPFPIFGDGTQTRAFSYIGDIAPVIARSIENKDCYGQIFNVGADKHYSINDLVKFVSDAFGVKAQVRRLPARKEVVCAYSDHSKIRKYFGAGDTVPIEEGIRRMAQWVRKGGIRKSRDFGKIEILKNLPPSWLEKS